ncbi:MAG: choice-of-anchor D domain-containing protein [Caldilineaceae bacterium]
MFVFNFSRPPDRCWGRYVLTHALVLALLAATFFTHTRPAYAATITVDGTTCTLADAIAAANTDAATGGCPAGSGADTLTITADVTLGAALPAISSDMTIQGDVASRFVSGNNAYRVFRVNSGTVTFQTLTIQEGKNQGGNGSDGRNGGGGGLGAGGGLFIDSGAITIQDVTFINNMASGGNGGGGGGGYLGGNGGGFDGGIGGLGGYSNGSSSGTGGGGGFGNGGGGGGGFGGGGTGGGGGFGGGGGGGGGTGGGGGFGSGSGSSTGGGGGGGGTGLGGAIFIRTGALTLSNSTFTSNRATGGSGGGVVGGGFGGGSGSSGGAIGGAIFICTVTQDASCSATVSGSGNTFSGNSATTSDNDTYGAITSLAAPEIDVTGNGASIASGDTTPSTADDTDFGSVDVAAGTVMRTFTILNTGTGALTLSGSPLVALSGANAADFTVTTQPASSVAANGSTTFAITFDPSATGTRTATVTIANDDSDEGSYTFDIQGAGATKATSQVTQLSFSKLSSTTTPDSSYPSQSTAGVLVARMVLRNNGGNIDQIYFRVNVLNNNNWLLNADGAPGQVGSRLTAANSALPGGDNLWQANESFTQDFRIGVMRAASIQFKVDLYAVPGVTASSTDSAGDELLGSYYIELDPNAPEGAHILYLPVVGQ